MKKYLLTSLLGVFTLFGTFTSAESFTFQGNGANTYNPSTFTTDGGIITISNVNINTNSSMNSFSIIKNYSAVCVYTTAFDPNYPDCDGFDLQAGTYKVNGNYGDPYSSLTLNIGSNSSGDNSGGDNSGGDNSGGTNSGTIIQGGIDNFTPVISRMIEIAGEFVPYIVYIFIGYLGVSLLWKAVKYIINYLKGKSTKAVKGR